MVKRIKRIPVKEISKRPSFKSPQRLFLLILLFGLILIAGKKFVDYLLTSDLFGIKEVKLYGYERTSIVSDELDRLKKKNIFKVNIKSLQQNLEKNSPEIKSVTVYKKLPDRIDIGITPRIPLASIATWPKALVDADGFVYSPQNLSDYKNLPRVTGINFGKSAIKINSKSDALQLRRALAVLSLLEKFGLTKRYKVNIVNISSYDNVKVSLKEGTRIELGSNNYEDKIKMLKEVLNDMEQTGKKARVIDLRSQEARIIF